jgi:light-regulated signal transduction histidine kinase (bacteriophytochrome)
MSQQQAAGADRERTAAALDVDENLRREAVEHRLAKSDLFAQIDKLKGDNNSLKCNMKILDDFACSISHDLKEPLRGISFYSALLLEDYRDGLNAEVAEKLKTLWRLTERLDRRVDAMLSFSRAGKGDFEVENVVLDDLLDEVLDSLHVAILARHATIRRLAPLPSVICSRVCLAAVFQNLISNAITYTDASDPWVEIGSESVASGRQGQQEQNHRPGFSGLQFYVKDNGIGVPAAQQETIFRIFNRLHHDDKYGCGVGAGLAIAKEIIEHHGGRIWVESPAGGGSKFVFTLGEGAVDANC